MSRLRSSGPAVSMLGIPFLSATKSFFSAAGRYSPTASAMCLPMAGAQVSPGDSMPAASKNPGAPSGCPKMKSPCSSWARSPAKDVITCLAGSALTLSPARFSTSCSPCPVVPSASGSSTSTAVGPASRFPWTVGVTSTPFPYLVGSWNRVWLT